MKILIIAAVVVVALVALGLALSVRIVKQYQKGVLFRPGESLAFPAPLMTTIAELGTFLAGEKHAAGLSAALPAPAPASGAANG